MKTFKNQQTEITMTLINEDKTKSITTMTYADLAIMTLNIPPKEGGWLREESRLRFDIEDKIKDLKVGDEVELENTEFKKIHELSAQNWQMKHRDTIAYEDYLDEVSKQK